eukprot:5602248-Pleurochrysis_carterae.AAC.1
MSAKPYALLVFRQKRWISLTTSDLLPGDLISLLPPRTNTAEPSAAGARAAARGCAVQTGL